MRVGTARPVIYLTGQSRKSRVKHVWICTLVGWLVLDPSYISQDVLSVFFTGIVCSIIIMWCERENAEESATHAWTISHARSARPPGRPDERFDERASYLCSLRPRQAA